MSEKHIFLLENEKGMERIITLLLKQARFRVTSFNTAEAALESMVPSNSVDGGDLLIIDIPGPEGSSLLQQVKNNGTTLPVIIITPYGNESTIRIPKSNSSLLLCSPFEPAELIGCINQLIENVSSQN